MQLYIVLEPRDLEFNTQLAQFSKEIAVHFLSVFRPEGAIHEEGR
jgi:hypothetical protein